MRATVRLWRDEAVMRRAAGAQEAVLPTPEKLGERQGIGLTPTERTSRFWVAPPAHVRCERELKLRGDSRLALTVGDGDRWWYRDPHFGIEPLEEQLVPVELPELSLFDPWPIVSDFELEAAPAKTCAGREAVAAVATARCPTGLLVAGADRYELAVDAERGVILSIGALFEGKPFQVYEIVDISFDEELEPELFRLEEAAAEQRPPTAPPPPARLRCSFCGKTQEEVMNLIAGPGVYVCDVCIDLCNDIISEARRTRVG